MSSCFSPPLLLFIAMRAFYGLSLWITPHLLFTYPDLHHRLLGDFIVGLKVAAAAIKKHRLESEEWARRREEERKQREERERRAQEHKRKAEFITELIGKWEEAERVRAFVKAMTECSVQLELSEKAKSDIQQLVDWTKEYTESLDPLSDLPDSIDEIVHPERKYAWLKW
jgi:hypothetical protein